MAVPATYADLGKSSRNVFTKGFIRIWLIKLDLKTKSENGLEFTSSGPVNTETTKAFHLGCSGTGLQGLAGQLQMNCETEKSQVTQSNFAVGYKTEEFHLHDNVNHKTEFGSSSYQKVNKKLEANANLVWTAGKSSTCFGIAA
ncbi:hypothetical protein P7K49_032055 [Saguinus oedipus]|uniref:Non-selective voltage-gated ion channel VDAC1 n=1 Tax=Saguinus oedipus TaxID=9490 RepID=A0ABQ9TX62_SAGOE|nr:hypothetical protein P7K49_032055 [Saguinus oedipus]